LLRVAKFTVIPGGGREREPPGVLQARRHFRQLIVELLRAIARGDDYESASLANSWSSLTMQSQARRPSAPSSILCSPTCKKE
jgi:hypothetical protein